MPTPKSLPIRGRPDQICPENTQQLLTPEYRCWRSIIQRTTNPRCKSYPHYGGRGITCDPRWVNDFMQFYEDVGPRPSAEHSIERINVEEGYTQSNVTWADRKAQARNKRNTLFLTYKGLKKPLMGWAEELGIDSTYIRRKTKKGFSLEKIVESYS